MCSLSSEHHNPGWDPSIVLDTNDNPHIAYVDYGSFNLKYAAFDGSTWNIETVDSTGNVGWDPSIALDANDNPHISYTDGTESYLRYAVFNGSTWDFEIVDSTGNIAGHISLVLDSGENPHISYHTYMDYDLKYAFYCGYALAGDMNDDCKVDFLDVQTFVNTCWLTAGPEGDLYVDSWVDFRDFAVMAKNWLIDCGQTPANPACVPK